MSQQDSAQTLYQRPSAELEGAEGTQGAVCREGVMPCPICGHEMPDLKGGKASICPVCGFKDSCCY